MGAILLALIPNFLEGRAQYVWLQRCPSDSTVSSTAGACFNALPFHCVCVEHQGMITVVIFAVILWRHSNCWLYKVKLGGDVLGDRHWFKKKQNRLHLLIKVLQQHVTQWGCECGLFELHQQGKGSNPRLKLIRIPSSVLGAGGGESNGKMLKKLFSTCSKTVIALRCRLNTTGTLWLLCSNTLCRGQT